MKQNIEAQDAPKAITVAEWIAALRSGEFKQTKHQLYLRDLDSYCVLGVAAKLTGDSLFAGSKIYDYNFLSDAPKELIRGNVLRIPAFLVPQKRSNTLVDCFSLVALNDELGLSFSEIADILEHAVKYYRKES